MKEMGMDKRPECAIKGCSNGALVLCKVEGFDKPVFVCGECFSNNKKVIGQVF